MYRTSAVYKENSVSATSSLTCRNTGFYDTTEIENGLGFSLCSVLLSGFVATFLLLLRFSFQQEWPVKVVLFFLLRFITFLHF